MVGQCIVCFFLRFSFNGSLSEFSTAWPGGVDGGGDRANGKFQRENKKTEITNRANSVFLGKKTKSRNGYRRRKKVKNNVPKSVLLLYGIPLKQSNMKVTLQNINFLESHR